jgi:hypothetical protein
MTIIDNTWDIYLMGYFISSIILGYVSSNNLMGRQDDYHPYYV